MTLDLVLKGAVRLVLGKVRAPLVWKIGLMLSMFTAALTGTISLLLVWKIGLSLSVPITLVSTRVGVEALTSKGVKRSRHWTLC